MTTQPIQIDPSKLAAAKAAYDADLNFSRPELKDSGGKSHAVDPFNVNADGSVTFNRWADRENLHSAQNTFFDDVEIDAKGNKTTVRRPAWQQVPEYYNDEAKDQFDYISLALKNLQTDGFSAMKSLYEKALKKVG